MPVDMRFDPETVATLRAHLMQRGRTLATLLAKVMAGDEPPELEAILAGKVGARPAELLRRTLDQVEARRQLLDSDDDRYGRCDVCAVDLGIVALTEMPWADRCVEHRK